MKTSILLASVAAAGVAAWLVKRKMARNHQPQHAISKSQKHMTDVFSKAKAYAQEHGS